MEHGSFKIKLLKKLFLVASATLVIVALYNIFQNPYPEFKHLALMELACVPVMLLSFFLIEKHPKAITLTQAAATTILFSYAIYTEVLHSRWQISMWYPVFVLYISVLLGPIWGIASSVYITVLTGILMKILTGFKEPWMEFYIVQLMLSLTIVAVIYISVYNQWEEKYRYIKGLAERDSLTGLYNRRKIIEQISSEIERVKRTGVPSCVLMIDLDDFKKINDTYGHLHGDKVLKMVGETIKRNIRKCDSCGRYGGDEFIILATGTTCIQALNLAERIKDSIKALGVSCSIGIIELTKDSNPNQVISLVDQALYKAKRSGKDSIELVELVA